MMYLVRSDCSTLENKNKITVTWCNGPHAKSHQISMEWVAHPREQIWTFGDEMPSQLDAAQSS